MVRSCTAASNYVAGPGRQFLGSLDNRARGQSTGATMLLRSVLQGNRSAWERGTTLGARRPTGERFSCPPAGASEAEASDVLRGKHCLRLQPTCARVLVAGRGKTLSPASSPLLHLPLVTVHQGELPTAPTYRLSQQFLRAATRNAKAGQDQSGQGVATASLSLVGTACGLPPPAGPRNVARAAHPPHTQLESQAGHERGTVQKPSLTTTHMRGTCTVDEHQAKEMGTTASPTVWALAD